MGDASQNERSVRGRIYDFVEVSLEGISTRKFNWFDLFIIVLICLNIVAVILSSVSSIETKFSNFFHWFEVFSVIIFSMEYVLRVFACPENPKYSSPLWGRIRYILTPLLLIDLLAILPFYLPMLIKVDLRFLRVLRLFRLLRVFKLGRYSRSLRLVGNVLSSKRGELLITVLIILILLIFSSSLLYFAEKEAQPDKFSSIPDSMWWSICTLTTVGYGDVFPITTLGKVFSSIISLLGIGLFALPAGILGAGFLEEMKKLHSSEQRKCPHCGKEIE